jgi:hypothetical protein
MGKQFVIQVKNRLGQERGFYGPYPTRELAETLASRFDEVYEVSVWTLHTKLELLHLLEDLDWLNEEETDD